MLRNVTMARLPSIARTVLGVVLFANLACAGAGESDLGQFDPYSLDSISCDAYSGTGCTCSRCCAPRWSATADALFLNRSDPSSRVLVVNTNDTTQSLNANDFDYGDHTGFDLSIRRRFATCCGLELRYFGIDHWDSAVTTATTANDLLRFNAAVPVFVTSGDAIAANFQSKLHNAEINASYQYNSWLGILAGFRYLELDERGRASLVNAAIPFDYSVQTRNRLYGAQLGLQSLLWCNHIFSLDVIGKAGIYGNDASHNASVSTPVASLGVSGSDSAAFVGEIGVNGSARLTDCLAIRGGYRLLWLDGIAAALDQLPSSDFFVQSGIDDSGDIFYQGAFIGVELSH